MSRGKEHINKIHKALLKCKGGFEATAKVAKVGKQWVSNCFNNEDYYHLPSAERVYFAANLVIDAYKKMNVYDEERKEERLRTMANGAD